MYYEANCAGCNVLLNVVIRVELDGKGELQSEFFCPICNYKYELIVKREIFYGVYPPDASVFITVSKKTTIEELAKALAEEYVKRTIPQPVVSPKPSGRKKYRSNAWYGKFVP